MKCRKCQSLEVIKYGKTKKKIQLYCKSQFQESCKDNFVSDGQIKALVKEVLILFYFYLHKTK